MLSMRVAEWEVILVGLLMVGNREWERLRSMKLLVGGCEEELSRLRL